MPLEFNLDLSNDNEDTIERGDGVDPGWYVLHLKDVYEDDKYPGTVVFQYEVKGAAAPINGKFNGRIIYDRLGDPDSAESDEARNAVTKRQKILVKRMGLVSTEDYGQSEVRGSWLDTIGTDFIGHVEPNIWTDKKTGQKRENTRIAFDGVYPLDYPVDKLPRSTPNEAKALFSASAQSAPQSATPPAKSSRKPKAAAQTVAATNSVSAAPVFNLDDI